MNNRLLHVFLFAAGASAVAGCNTTRVTPPEQTPEDQVNLFELRTYLAAEGKLPALESRFANHTMALFERHGMKNVAYWRATEKPNTLVYVVGHQSRSAAKASWKNFGRDPEWQAAFRKSRIDGPLVVNIESTFLEATEFQSLKNQDRPFLEKSEALLPKLFSV